MDELEYKPKLSDIAWSLVTQVGTHSAEQNFFSIPKLTIIYIQQELSTIHVVSLGQLF